MIRSLKILPLCCPLLSIVTYGVGELGTLCWDVFVLRCLRILLPFLEVVEVPEFNLNRWVKLLGFLAFSLVFVLYLLWLEQALSIIIVI